MKLGNNRKYLKINDLKGGEVITILDEGVQEDSTRFKYPDGNPVKNYCFKIELEGQELSMNMNKTSRTQMSIAFGDETSLWIGKKAKILKELDRKSGKYCLYLEPIQEDENVPF